MATMSTRAFISYAHADTEALGRLHKHLAVLRREGSIEAWSDHEIMPGATVDQEIHESLESCSLFLALVSPDYLASHYCYEKEFTRALELRDTGRMHVVPIIIEECDWRRSPLGKLLALPKDGKAVATFTNQNIAYLDVVAGIRRLLESGTIARDTPVNAAEQVAAPSGRRLRVKQDFDSIQKSEFVDNSFDAIRDYFDSSCRELNDTSDGTIKAKYELMDKNAFTCTVVNRAKARGGEHHITVKNSKQQYAFGDISYVYKRHATDGSSNGGIRVEADETNLFLTMDTMIGRGNKAEKLTAKQAAEVLWLDFVKQVGIDYE
jgi:hypothetical protein